LSKIYQTTSNYVLGSSVHKHQVCLKILMICIYSLSMVLYSTYMYIGIFHECHLFVHFTLHILRHQNETVYLLQ